MNLELKEYLEESLRLAKIHNKAMVSQLESLLKINKADTNVRGSVWVHPDAQVDTEEKKSATAVLSQEVVVEGDEAIEASTPSEEPVKTKRRGRPKTT